MKKHIKFFAICLSAFILLCSISCNNVGDQTEAQSTSGTDQTPDMPPPPESSYESITVEGNSFDIPEAELEILALNEGEGVLKFFRTLPMDIIGYGELEGNRTNMAEIINKSQQIYSIYNNKIDIDDNDPELDIDQKKL